MLILTEVMFVRIMLKYSRGKFSWAALKLIYKHHSKRDAESTEFYEIDIEKSFTEELLFDCIKNNNIPVEGLTEADEFKKIEIMQSVISDFLGAKTDVLGFTSHHTVVYEKNY